SGASARQAIGSAGIVRRAWPRRIALGWAVAFALLMLGAGLAMLLGDPGFERRLLEGRGLPPDAKGLGWMLTAVGAWACAALLWFGARRPVAAMLGGLAGLWVLFGLVGYPVLNDASSARGLMTAVGQRIGPQAELGLVAWKEQNLLMADRPATDFGFREPWDEQLRRGFDWLAGAPDGRRWLLVQAPALQCVDRAASIDAGVANRRRWSLVPRAAVVPDCRPQPLRAQDEGDDD
ncbi:MAG TPA: dolichyl-phosphate-mannose--protein mannosyltransferase, partial [Xanthomonadaceae bacterium]|nr:dolichyl-phosphate-mannose--protein mannosyltransferase [Xanthomonadaceae bacterium]